MQNHSNKYITDKSIDEVISTIKPELEKNGFQIIQKLDIDKILQEAVSPTFDEYKIIGICNPKLSHELLTQDKSIGLFLPCKIVLYRDENKTKILFQRPTWISSFFYSKHIESVTTRIEELLDNIIKKSL